MNGQTVGGLTLVFYDFLDFRKLGDGLFLESCREVSKLYPKIEFGDMIVDNCCMQVQLVKEYGVLLASKHA